MTDRVIAEDRVASDGTYRLSLGDASVLEEHMGSSGLVDGEVLLQGRGGVESRFIVVSMDRRDGAVSIGSTQVLDPVTLGGGESKAMGVEAWAGSAPLSADDGLARETDLVHERHADDLHQVAGASKRPLGEATVPPECLEPTRYVKYLGQRKTFVAAHHDTTSGISHQLDLSEGASARLGIGVSATGKKGSFRLSGESSRSLSSWTQWPKSSGESSGLHLCEVQPLLAEVQDWYTLDGEAQRGICGHGYFCSKGSGGLEVHELRQGEQGEDRSEASLAQLLWSGPDSAGTQRERRERVQQSSHVALQLLGQERSFVRHSEHPQQRQR